MVWRCSALFVIQSKNDFLYKTKTIHYQSLLYRKIVSKSERRIQKWISWSRNIPYSTIKRLIDKFEKMISVCQVKEERKRWCQEVKQNHTDDRRHMYHFQSLFSVTGTGSACINLWCYVRNKISILHSHLWRTETA